DRRGTPAGSAVACVRQGDRQGRRHGVHARATNRIADDLHGQRQAAHRARDRRRRLPGRAAGVPSPWIADTRSVPDARQEPKLLDTLGQDAQQVWTDARRLGLVRSFRRTLHELQTFYLSTPTRDRLLEMPKFRRGIYLVIWLLKSLLLKLTPTRRILLALSFVLMLQGTGVQKLGETLSINIRFPFLGIAVLLLVLMLELKDKLVARSELEAGRSVQQALMPQSSPTIPGWDVWMFTKSANDVGGDLVDYLRLDQDRVGVG